MSDSTTTGELWLVTVSEERTASFWVRAPDRETAQADADVLASSLVRDAEWDETERNVDVAQERRIRRSPEPGEQIWTGGSDGDWETAGGEHEAP